MTTSEALKVLEACEWLKVTGNQLQSRLLEIERHCPCGARPESLDTHPHVGDCPVEAAIRLCATALDQHAATARALVEARAIISAGQAANREQALHLDNLRILKEQAEADREAHAEALKAQWRCFHCDEVFTDKAEALEHFGADESKDPACRITADDVKRVRELESDVDLWQRRALSAEMEAEGLAGCHSETMRLTNGHGVFMTLDYLEGEKLVLKERAEKAESQVAALTASINNQNVRRNDMSQIPTIGRIVHYRLSAEDAKQIRRRRTDGSSIAARMKQAVPTVEPDVLLGEKIHGWPAGAQAHIGNSVEEGDTYPMMIVRVWGAQGGVENSLVNGQVFLDGNDVLWAMSVSGGDGPGEWNWPPRG